MSNVEHPFDLTLESMLAKDLLLIIQIDDEDFYYEPIFEDRNRLTDIKKDILRHLNLI